MSDANIANEADHIDLEGEWAELRAKKSRASGERADLWFFPVLLLYTGFFFGPFATMLASAFTVRGRMSARDAGIILGACGAAWWLLQGLSIYNGGWWSEIELQGARSTLNFSCGILAYVVVRPVAIASFQPTRVTVFVSGLVIAMSIGAFLLLPGSLLVALGR